MSVLIRAIGVLPRRWIKAAARLQWRHPLAKSAFDHLANRIRNRDGLIQQGLGRGLRFNAGGSLAGFMLGTSAPGLQAAFALFARPRMSVFDVGANVGFCSVLLARLVGAEGAVVSFEPLANNARMIHRNAKANAYDHITVHELALGKVDGHASFALSENPNWGKLASIGAPAKMIGEESVRVARLDSLLRERTVPPPDLIKIDVEGGEVDVLEGAEETLRSARPILLIDLHGTNAAVARLLEEQDYEARVLGGGRTRLTDARWDVEVVAVPRERTELVARIEQMANWSPDGPNASG